MAIFGSGRSAGGVVVNSDGLVLVVNQHGRAWSLPKGYIEDGETEIEAAKREIYEESGIKKLEFVCKLGEYQRYRISLDGGDDKSITKKIVIFLFITDEGELNPVDPENPEARWVEIGKVSDLLTHYKDRKFFLSVMDKINKNAIFERREFS